NFPAAHPAFMNRHFGAVEPTAIVDGCHHEFYREMHLEIQALITFHCIGSRMGLTERISRKRFDLPVHFRREFFRMSEFMAGFEYMILLLLQGSKASAFSTHGSSQDIAIFRL